MFGFVKGLLQLLKAIVSSLLGTLSDLASALRNRSGSKAFSLLREGSPLESLVDSVLSLVFWIVVLTPFVLFPVVYLFMALMR
jgi:hypothetical protein